MVVFAPASACCCPVGSDAPPAHEGIAVSIAMPGGSCCGPAAPGAAPAPTQAPDPPEEPLSLSITPNGRVRQENLASTTRNLAVVIHLISLPAFLLLGPLAGLATLALWLIGKDKSVFVDEHGREAVNFEISFLIYHMVLAITFLGIVLFPVLWIFAIVNQIRGALAAGRSEYFRYPMILRFIS